MARPKPEIIYENTVPAIFVQRNNRFTAEVMVGDEQKTVHIKITGGTLDTSRYRNAK